MEIRVRMREGSDGRWVARADSRPPVEASGSSQDRCLANLRRTIRRSARTPGSAHDTLVVEVVPLLAGVAEAAEIMGWDKRRVITYIDRGSFPAPAQSLASGRVWLRSDVERFGQDWRARQAARAKRS